MARKKKQASHSTPSSHGTGIFVPPQFKIDATPEQIIDLFVDSLANPHRPKHCATFIHGCALSMMCRLVPYERLLQNIDILCEKHHGFWDASMRFLTVERSDEQRNELKLSLEECSCDKATNNLTKSLHDVSEDMLQQPACDYVSLIELFITILHTGVQAAKANDKLHKVDYNLEKAVRAGKASPPWPTKPQDILPYGADASMTAMIAWVPISPKPVVIGLLASIMEICKKQVIHSVVSSPVLSHYAVGIAEIPVLTWMVMQETGPGRGNYTPTKLLADLKRCAVFFHNLVSFSDKTSVIGFFSRDEDFNAERAATLANTTFKFLPDIVAAADPLTLEGIPAADDVTYIIQVTAAAPLVKSTFWKSLRSVGSRAE